MDSVHSSSRLQTKWSFHNRVEKPTLLTLLPVFVTVVSADISSVGKNFDVVFPVNNADYVMNSTISLEFIRYGGPKSSVDINIDYPLFTSKKGTVVRRVKRIYVHLVSRGQSKLISNDRGMV
ncbi:hypothetical protein AB6A40_008518 [Gnathostoma spinigerum]|uniref:Uncharacterized protein n=1 Tax=Gnathostoma spinigerum TaxID=75299 RepID=A0ABD6EPA7_9BILA